jgi:hypothetical protein
MKPYSGWNPKQDDNVSSPKWSVEPDSLGRTKRSSTNRANGRFEMPLLTPRYSPAPHQLDRPAQQSSADTGEHSVTDKEAKETEYSKELVAKCLLPFIPIQDELIRLFFIHIHPMFPIMDEYSFVEIYEKHSTNSELMAPEHFLLLLAISFVAFAVCPTLSQTT